MADGAEVHGLGLLLQLDSDLRRFADRAREVLERVRQESERAAEIIADGLADRQDEVRCCQDELEEARYELRQARADEDGDVAGARRAVAEAEDRLAAAEAARDEVRHWQDQLAATAADYERQARQLETLVTDDAAQAAGSLRARLAELERYVGESAADGAGLVPSSAAGGATVPAVTVVGSPQGSRSFQRYQSSGTCAVVAQQMVLLKHTGIDHGEAALLDEAVTQGWAEPEGGTLAPHRGRLLEAHGVPINRWFNGEATLDTLREELQQGHDVIVSGDAEPLYGPGYSGSHALWVTGLELRGGVPARVFVQDSNEGAPTSYPIDVFMTAWEGSRPNARTMISTRSAAAERQV